MEKPAQPEAASTEPGVQTARQLAAKILAASPGGTYGQIPVDYLTAAIEARDRQHEAALEALAALWKADETAGIARETALEAELEARINAINELHVLLADLRTNARAEKTRLQNALAEETQARSDEFFRLTSLRDVLLHERDDATAALTASKEETAKVIEDRDGWMSVYGKQVRASAGYVLERDDARARLGEAVGALERIEALKRERGGLHAYDENACGLCRAIEIARRALAALPEKP